MCSYCIPVSDCGDRIRARCTERFAERCQSNGRHESENNSVFGGRLGLLGGQSYNLTSDWPRFEVPSIMRTIDYDAKSLREERTRRQGNYPTYGRLPLQEERITAMLSGNFAWNMRGDATVPQTGRFLEGPPVAELRQLEIALTPHGFLKAALAGNPTAMSEPIVGPSDGGLSSNGRKVTIVSFTALGKYKVNGTSMTKISLSSSRLGFLTLFMGTCCTNFGTRNTRISAASNFQRWFTYIGKTRC